MHEPEKKLTLAAMSIFVMIAPVVAAPSAHAMATCANDGVLCIRDDQRPWYDQWGALSGNNKRWSSFGWNDKADYFRNRGLSCSVRVYEHRDYKGAKKSILRGRTLTWKNIVSSNKWYNCD